MSQVRVKSENFGRDFFRRRQAAAFFIFLLVLLVHTSARAERIAAVAAPAPAAHHRLARQRAPDGRRAAALTLRGPAAARAHRPLQPLVLRAAIAATLRRGAAGCACAWTTVSARAPELVAPRAEVAWKTSVSSFTWGVWLEYATQKASSGSYSREAVSARPRATATTSRAPPPRRL